MKVTCQSCGAQYNLPDEKIRGRKAKVRCKKCSERIVVDGTALLDFDDDEATRVMQTASFTESGDLLWTVNLSDEEQLEMTEPEVLAGWRDGTLTDDAYVWREGMDEWLPILEAPVLGDAIRGIDATAGAATVRSEAEPEAEAEQEPATPLAAPVAPEPSAPTAQAFPPSAESHSTPQPSAVGSLPSTPSLSKPKSEDTSKAFSFALGGSSGAAAKKPQSRVPAAPTGGGLFDRSVSSAPPPPAAGPAPEASENSVMFSLDALKAAAAVEPQKPRAAVVDDVRVNEDILTLGGPSRFDDNSMPLIDVEVPPEPPREETRMAAAAPVLAAPPRSGNAIWYGFAGAAVLALGVGAYFGFRSDAPVADRTGVAATDSREGTAVATGPASGESTASPTSEAETPAASATAPTDTTEADDPKAAPKPAQQPSPNVAAVSPRPSPAPDPKDKPSPSPSPAPAPAPKKEAPGKPFSISAAKSALSSAAASAKGCKAPAGPFGTGKVQVTFAPSGNVTSALIVSGPFGGTPVGSCVARTFRSAKVPAFDGGAKTVAKSFSIK